MIRWEVGQQGPGFDLIDQHGATRSLRDWRGHKVVLFCFPAAGTPGCTKQTVDFQQVLPVFQEAGYAVLGMSPDPVEKLARVSAEQHLRYPLLSDPSRDTLRTWGAFGEKKLYGKVVTGVIRSTFVMDGEGRITLAKYNVRATGHVASLSKLLGLG